MALFTKENLCKTNMYNYSGGTARRKSRLSPHRVAETRQPGLLVQNHHDTRVLGSVVKY